MRTSWPLDGIVQKAPWEEMLSSCICIIGYMLAAIAGAKISTETDFVVLVTLLLYAMLCTPVLIGISRVLPSSSVDTHGHFICTI